MPPVYHAIFIEFEDMPAADPNAAAATTFAKQLEKIFNDKIRPFQHARLIMDHFTDYTPAELAKDHWDVHADATGWAFDAGGNKDRPRLKFAAAEPWNNQTKGYEAQTQFLGFSKMTKEEVEDVTEKLVKKKKKYDVIWENCWHFAVDTAFEILAKEKGVHSIYNLQSMPGGLKEYPLLEPDA